MYTSLSTIRVSALEVEAVLAGLMIVSKNSLKFKCRKDMAHRSDFQVKMHLLLVWQ